MSGKIGYKEIFETLRKEVLDGKYDDTTVLPSEWALARRFGVFLQPIKCVALVPAQNSSPVDF